MTWNDSNMSLHPLNSWNGWIDCETSIAKIEDDDDDHCKNNEINKNEVINKTKNEIPKTKEENVNKITRNNNMKENLNMLEENSRTSKGGRSYQTPLEIFDNLKIQEEGSYQTSEKLINSRIAKESFRTPLVDSILVGCEEGSYQISLEKLINPRIAKESSRTPLVDSTPVDCRKEVTKPYYAIQHNPIQESQKEKTL